MEDDGLARELGKLRDRALVRPRLADGTPAAIGDLIRADDERVRVRAGATLLALASARRKAVAAGGSSASGDSSVPGATATKGRPRRSSSIFR